MRGKAAKTIRKEFYGDRSTRSSNRDYFKNKASGQIHADEQRRIYQKLKKIYRNEKKSLKEMRRLIALLKPSFGSQGNRKRAGHPSPS